MEILTPPPQVKSRFGSTYSRVRTTTSIVSTGTKSARPIWKTLSG